MVDISGHFSLIIQVFFSLDIGHLKSMDLNRNKTHGSPYSIAYRPSSAITHTSIATMEEKDEKFNPQRPNHLGMVLTVSHFLV